MIALPPSNGATNETVTCAFPATAVGCAGGSGTPFGSAAADAADAALVPLTFVAVTVHVYDFPFDSPPTTMGEPAPDPAPATPAFDDTHAALYPVIALPPSNGATNVTVTCAFPATTVGGAGASGARFGMTATDGDDAAPVPLAFVAATVHVYDFPFVNPPTTVGDAASEAEPVVPPFDDTHATWYPVIALPPSAGGTNDTVTCAFPATTVGCGGALGSVLGIAIADAADAAPVPFAFVAATVHVYDFPFVRPPITVGDAGSATEPGAPPFDDTHAT